MRAASSRENTQSFAFACWSSLRDQSARMMPLVPCVLVPRSR